MKSWIQFITVPTADTPATALLLHFDQKRYLIGQIGEGTQRACVEHGVSLKKVEDLLITGRCESKSTGGIIGMILTVADVVATARQSAMENQKAKVKGTGDETILPTKDENLFLTMYGPPNLTHSIATARRFVFRKGLPIKIHEMRAEEPQRDAQGKWLPTWADENIRVWAMPIRPVVSEQVAGASHETLRKGHKRSLDEANGVVPDDEVKESEAERGDRYDQLRRDVVADMFSSNWHMDTLIETPLDEVHLPARLWIRNQDTKDLVLYSGPLPGGSEPLPDPIPKVFVRKPWPGALVTSLPPTNPREEAVSYIIGTYPRRGKYDAKAAKAYGVRAKQNAALTRGQSIVTDEGKTVTPDMVLGPDVQGGGVAVVDLPTNEYVEELISRAEWKSEEVMLGVGGIIWILGPTVAANPMLRKFMEEMSDFKHTVSSPDYCPNNLAMDGAAASSIRLAQIDTDHYAIPHFDDKTLPQASFQTAAQAPIENLPLVAVVAQRGQTVQLEPKFEIQSNQVKTPLDTISLLQEPASKGVLDLAQTARASLDTPEFLKELEAFNSNIPLQDAEIIALGTGSALPSKYRNVSATLVRVPGYGSYLLDAGENTLGQMQRVFPPTELIEVLKDLRMIWISHLHADHHLGTVPVIKAWHKVVHGPDSAIPTTSLDIFKDLSYSTQPTIPDERPKYLAVVSDVNMLHYLLEYSCVEDYGYEHVLPLFISPADVHSREPSQLTLNHRDCPSQVVISKFYPALLGLSSIQAVYVNHCHGARAVALTFPRSDDGNITTRKPFKVAYSGDCRPSASFAAIGVDTTVLIHEATFEDELIGDAIAKKHSTVREALGVGTLMGAKCVMLTHFSQRYQKIPVMDNFWTAAEAITEAIQGENEEQERHAGIETEEEIRPEIAPVDANVLADEQAPVESANTEDLFATEDISAWGRPSAVSMSSSLDMKVVVAFDYMRVKVGEIAKMEKFRPALSKLFEEDIEEEELKKAKRISQGDADSIKSGHKTPKPSRQARKAMKKAVEGNVE